MAGRSGVAREVPKHRAQRGEGPEGGIRNCLRSTEGEELMPWGLVLRDFGKGLELLTCSRGSIASRSAKLQGCKGMVQWKFFEAPVWAKQIFSGRFAQGWRSPCPPKHARSELLGTLRYLVDSGVWVGRGQQQQSLEHSGAAGPPLRKAASPLV